MRATIAILVLAALALFANCSGDLDTFSALDSAGDAPDILTGSVRLENMENHSGVRVELTEISTSLVTDDGGAFILPENLAEGEWTVKTSYPYFSDSSQTFTVKNGKPEKELQTIQMQQKIRFDVVTDKFEYLVGETVHITMTAHNLSDEDITLSSTLSPQVALAVVKEEMILVGDLLPGDLEEAESITIEPAIPQVFEISWMLDDVKMESGSYEIYSVITDNVNFPSYFSHDTTLLEQFNYTLFEKLSPAIIAVN